MSVLLITCELKNSYKDYTPFFDALKSNSHAWCHYFDKTWIVSTDHSAQEYAHFLYPHMEGTDRLLVVRITKEQQGWLQKEAWEWLNAKRYD